ncbi:unnamed protein product [Pylaiella littoralis]
MGFTPLYLAAALNRSGVIDLFFEARGNMEPRLDGTGDTPLHVAATHGKLIAVLALLQHGEDVSNQNTARLTPWHLAAAQAGTLGTAEVVDVLLRRGADENSINSNGQTAADMIGSRVSEQASVAKDVESVRVLLKNAPADRAWRRRGFLVLCRAHFLGGRVQLRQARSHAHAGTAKRTCDRAEASRAEVEWAGVASMLVQDGANIIFEAVVGYL